MKSYNTISDSAVSVSASEIQKYYNEHQYLFEQQESRQIAYVNFDITASAEDIQETEDWVNSLKGEFAAATDPVEFANLSSEQKVAPGVENRCFSRITQDIAWQFYRPASEWNCR